MSNELEFLQRLEIEYLQQVVKYQRRQIRDLWKGVAWLLVCIVVFYLMILFEVAQ